MRDAITRGDYATARRITASVLADSKLQRWHFYPFEGFMGGVADVYDPAFGAHVTEWVARDPSDPIALLISAQYKLQRGWFVRGTDFSYKIEAGRRLSYTDYLADALGDVEQSIRHDNRNPFAFSLKLEILYGFGLHKDLLPQFETAIAHFPAYFPLYETVLGILEPRWGGSVDAMYIFVDQYAGRAPSGAPLKLLYVELYEKLLGLASTTCANVKGDRDLRQRCVELAMQRLVRPELEAHLKDAFSAADAGDRSEFDAAAGRTLSEIAGTDDAQAIALKLLETAGAAMHSDTKLEAGNPGHNDYAIDNALSNYWHAMGSLDNALKKAKEALLDIENTRFPSAAEKNEALAAVHEQMARLYTDLGRATDAIDAEQAALDLGVRAEQPQLLCSAIYGLKDYPRAIEVCSHLVDGHPGNMFVRFWRGQAYAFSKQPVEAEADLKAVAESSNPFRVHAAMSIAMMHLSDRNYRAAVDTLNRYPFLFNPTLSSEKDVALTYMNRCYAESQLGDLQRALDDCNQSVRFGLPGGAQYLIADIERRLAEASAKPTTVAH
ncbi:MAG TPA: hypothetical protein VIJ42_15410 [Stellaceae bacterium]